MTSTADTLAGAIATKKPICPKMVRVFIRYEVQEMKEEVKANLEKQSANATRKKANNSKKSNQSNSKGAQRKGVSIHKIHHPPQTPTSHCKPQKGKVYHVANATPLT